MEISSLLLQKYLGGLLNNFKIIFIDPKRLILFLILLPITYEIIRFQIYIGIIFFLLYIYFYNIISIFKGCVYFKMRRDIFKHITSYIL